MRWDFDDFGPISEFLTENFNDVLGINDSEVTALNVFLQPQCNVHTVCKKCNLLVNYIDHNSHGKSV